LFGRLRRWTRDRGRDLAHLSIRFFTGTNSSPGSADGRDQPEINRQEHVRRPFCRDDDHQDSHAEIGVDESACRAGGFSAWLVYRYLGLKFVSRSWFNLDATWAVSLILVGALSLAIILANEHWAASQ
jgi:hypothetical protein